METDRMEAIERLIDDFKREFPTSYGVLYDGCVSEKTKELMCNWLRERLRVSLI